MSDALFLSNICGVNAFLFDYGIVKEEAHLKKSEPLLYFIKLLIN